VTLPESCAKEGNSVVSYTLRLQRALSLKSYSTYLGEREKKKTSQRKLDFVLFLPPIIKTWLLVFSIWFFCYNETSMVKCPFLMENNSQMFIDEIFGWLLQILQFTFENYLAAIQHLLKQYMQRCVHIFRVGQLLRPSCQTDITFSPTFKTFTRSIHHKFVTNFQVLWEGIELFCTFRSKLYVCTTLERSSI
jgi:hypothetical protein